MKSHVFNGSGLCINCGTNDSILTDIECKYSDETPLPTSQTTLEGQNALRVKVAELCPTLFDIHETWRDRKLTKYVSWKDDEEIQEREWLAACAEFEKGLTEDQQYLYVGHLAGKHWAERWSFTEILTLTFATAEQRCRAFVALHEGTK